MHPEMKYDDDLLDTGDDLAPLLDLKFILLIALIVVLTYFAQKQLDNRFAIPSGPGSGVITLGEKDYQRMVVVSVDAGGTLQVNEEAVSEDRLADRLHEKLPQEELSDGPPAHVIFNAHPDLSHGEAERVYLSLLRFGFTVLREYEEYQDER